MAVYDLEEQEKLSELKAWWNQHGNRVTALLTAAAVIAVAWQAWNWHRGRQAAEASVLYTQVQKAVAGRDAKKAREVAGSLIEQYPGSAYATLGAFLSAKVSHEAGDLKTPRAQLAWVVENAPSDELRDLARVRLAAVLADDKAYDEALKQVERESVASFARRFAEQRGDILALQGKRAEARTAYQAALARLGPEEPGSAGDGEAAARQMLQMKLDAIGEAQ